MLIDTLRTDLITAQKARDGVKTETLRFLLSAIKNFAIDHYGPARENEISDEDVTAILRKQVKSHEESINIFTKADRGELAEKEEKELLILKAYLPAEATDEEIEKVVRSVIDSGVKDFGPAMGRAMGQLKGKASGDRVSTVVKKLLSS